MSRPPLLLAGRNFIAADLIKKTGSVATVATAPTPTERALQPNTTANATVTAATPSPVVGRWPAP